MTNSERNKVLQWAKGLTDGELESEYYDYAFDCLGSQAEEMYERGYDMVDIREREAHEKWLCEMADLLAQLCEGRGIKLWYEEDSEVESTNDCSGCVHENADDTTEDIGNCVCCSRINDVAKNDYYKKRYRR